MNSFTKYGMFVGPTLRITDDSSCNGHMIGLWLMTYYDSCWLYGTPEPDIWSMVHLGKLFVIGQVSVGCFLEKSLIDYILFSVVVGGYCSCPNCTRHNTINWIIDTKWLAICFSINRAVSIELAITKPNFGDPGMLPSTPVPSGVRPFVSTRTARIESDTYKFELFIARSRSEPLIAEMNGQISRSALLPSTGCSPASPNPNFGVHDFVGYRLQPTSFLLLWCRFEGSTQHLYAWLHYLNVYYN